MIAPTTRGERWALRVARRATRCAWEPAAFLVFGVFWLVLALIAGRSFIGAVCWVFAVQWTLISLIQFERLQFGRLLARQDGESQATAGNLSNTQLQPTSAGNP